MTREGFIVLTALVAVALVAGAVTLLILRRRGSTLTLTVPPGQSLPHLGAQSLAAAAGAGPDQWSWNLVDTSTPGALSWFGEMASPDRHARVRLEGRGGSGGPTQVLLRADGSTGSLRSTARRRMRLAGAAMIRSGARTRSANKGVIVLGAAGLAAALIASVLAIPRTDLTTTSPPIEQNTSSSRPTPGEAAPPAPGTPAATGPESSAPSLAAKPDGAKGCKPTFDSRVSPTRSAVDASTTSCEFGEEVRRAYLDADPQGAPVTLRDVYSPKTGQLYVMSCRGAALVRCTGGIRAVVWLYR